MQLARRQGHLLDNAHRPYERIGSLAVSGLGCEVEAWQSHQPALRLLDLANLGEDLSADIVGQGGVKAAQDFGFLGGELDVDVGLGHGRIQPRRRPDASDIAHYKFGEEG